MYRYKMGKIGGQVICCLRLLFMHKSSGVSTRWLASSSVPLHINSQTSLNYCQRRFFLATERLLSVTSRRQVSTSSACHDKEKPKRHLRDELTEDEDKPQHDSLTHDHNTNHPPSKPTEQKPPTELRVTERLRPPPPIKDERESSLPNHDKERITEESRKLERKANTIFTELAEKRGAMKQTFIFATEKFVARENVYWRGAVEFIYAGMQEMQHFGVSKDLDSYKALIQTFPEGKMIPRNAWQVEFMHYPRHQQCGIDLLEQMEHNGVIPDAEFGVMLKNRFGREAHVTRKFRRMLYWLPKFKNINPYPIPMELPLDPRELALLALKRMSVDRETQYHVFETIEEEQEPEEDTFVASGQSPTQQRLIREHKMDQPLFVEGPYPVYLRELRQDYFLLRAEPNINALMKQKQREKEEENDENLFEWSNFFEDETSSELRPLLSVHEQDDSTILALGITGTSSKSSAMSWVRCLEKMNPRLAQIPVLFKLISYEESAGVLDVIGDNRPFRDFQKTMEKIGDK